MIVPCYYIICFGCLMSINMHFYFIFGTNLLTGGLVPVYVFFAYFSVSQKRNIKPESKWNETFARIFLGINATQETWSTSLEVCEASMRQGHAQGGRRAPTLAGPMELHRRTSFVYIYSYTLKTSRRATKPLFHRRNLLYP